MMGDSTLPLPTAAHPSFRQYRALLVRYLKPQTARVILMSVFLLIGIAVKLINPQVLPEEIRSELQQRYDFQKPVPIEEVTGDVIRYFRDWNVQVTHPRYFGLFNPSVQPASIAADTLTATCPFCASNRVNVRTAPSENLRPRFVIPNHGQYRHRGYGLRAAEWNVDLRAWSDGKDRDGSHRR